MDIHSIRGTANAFRGTPPSPELFLLELESVSGFSEIPNYLNKEKNYSQNVYFSCFGTHVWLYYPGKTFFWGVFWM